MVTYWSTGAELLQAANNTMHANESNANAD
jgi:hypothetical protein